MLWATLCVADPKLFDAAQDLNFHVNTDSAWTLLQIIPFFISHQKIRLNFVDFIFKKFTGNDPDPFYFDADPYLGNGTDLKVFSTLSALPKLICLVRHSGTHNKRYGISYCKFFLQNDWNGVRVRKPAAGWAALLLGRLRAVPHLSHPLPPSSPLHKMSRHRVLLKGKF